MIKQRLTSKSEKSFKLVNEQAAFIHALNALKQLCTKVDYALFDELSSEKRSKREKPFSSPIYDFLLSIISPSTGTYQEMKEAKLSDIKAKLLTTDEQKNVELSQWRTEHVLSLCKDGRIYFGDDSIFNCSDDSQRMFLTMFQLRRCTSLRAMCGMLKHFHPYLWAVLCKKLHFYIGKVEGFHMHKCILPGWQWERKSRLPLPKTVQWHIWKSAL